MAQATTDKVSASEQTQVSPPSHGVAIGTSILTLDGLLPVEFLTPGDRVLTRSGAHQIRQIEVTVIENARAIVIDTDTLGTDRPVSPMIVAPEQPILIRDWRAKALCGTSSAMIAAARLADGEYIRAAVIPELRLYTLIFDRAEVIYADGLELGCQGTLITA